MRVRVVTGSRDFIEAAEKYATQVLEDIQLLIVGDAKGVDKYFRLRADKALIDVAPFRAFWEEKGKIEGRIRNSRMIVVAAMFRSLGAEVVGAAFPGPNSIGTYHCMEEMKAFQINYKVYRLEGISNE